MDGHSATIEPSDADQKRAKLRRALDGLGAAIEDRRLSELARLERASTWATEAADLRLSPRQISDTAWAHVIEEISHMEDADDRHAMARMLRHLIKVAGLDLLNSDEPMSMRVAFGVMLALHSRWRQWVRPIETWEKPAGETAPIELLRSLTGHLCRLYPVPEFLEAVWDKVDSKWKGYRDLYLHLGRGGSMRDAPLPVQLTRKGAHIFLTSPPRMTIDYALLRADIMATGIDEDLARELATTYLGKQLHRSDRRAFWLETLAFLARHPEFAREQGRQAIDFLEFRRFGARPRGPTPRANEEVFTGDPTYSLKGRTPKSLLAHMEAWHLQLRQVSVLAQVSDKPFRPAGFAGIEIGLGNRRLFDGHDRLRFVELLSGAELHAEGASLEHCVVSYAGRCRSGECSIWSMRSVDRDGKEYRRLTIEVTRDRRIVQVRGMANASPSTVERDAVRYWASRVGLSY